MRNNKKFITTPRSSGKKKPIKDFVSIIILGENHGHRMKSFGPLPLIKMGGETLLEHQVKTISSVFSDYEIILCVGFEAKKISEFVRKNFEGIPIRVVENQVHYNTNCSESARIAINNTRNHRCLIISGGVVINADFLTHMNYENNNIVVQDSNSMGTFEINALYNKTRLKSLTLGEKFHFWTETIFIKEEKTMNKFYNILSDPENKTKFLFETVSDLCRREKIYVQDMKDMDIKKIDNMKTYKEIGLI